MPTFSFQNPVVLAALAVLPAFYLLWRRACRRAAAGRQFVPDGRNAERQRRLCRADALRGALRIGALGSVILGLAGPEAFRGGTLPSALRESVPVVFVLDVSASMKATDVRPDRLAVARDAIAHICALLPGERAGLVAVAEDAAVACPPTADSSAFVDILSQIRTNWMGAGGTCLSAGVAKARSLILADGGSGVAVIVSDGEDHGEPLEPLLRQMRRGGIATHTVVVGSPQGARLETLPAPGALEPVITRANPQQMAAWAAEGGGRAWSVTPESQSLASQPTEVIPLASLKTAARDSGAAIPLAVCFYVLATALLLVDVFIRP